MLALSHFPPLHFGPVLLSLYLFLSPSYRKVYLSVSNVCLSLRLSCPNVYQVQGIQYDGPVFFVLPWCVRISLYFCLRELYRTHIRKGLIPCFAPSVTNQLPVRVTCMVRFCNTRGIQDQRYAFLFNRLRICPGTNTPSMYLDSRPFHKLQIYCVQPSTSITLWWGKTSFNEGPTFCLHLVCRSFLESRIYF